jgi:ribose transport system ATP-binding protein
MQTATAEPFHLVATGLRKSFSGNEVLHGVAIEAQGGRVLALLGENGAGKSTTVKILAGDYRRDDGEIRVNGQPVRIDSPADAQAVGVKVIFQEFMDAPELTVAENIALGALPNRFGIVNWRQTEQQARKILAELGVAIDPSRTVQSLGVAERQILEIARALVGDARLLILDEPTSALAAEEVEALFEFIRGLRRRGVAIIYITHRLDELAEIADDVVIFRDGYVVASGLVADMTTEDLIDAMVGKQLHHEFEELEEQEEIGHVTDTVHPVLQLRDVTVSGHTEEVSFAVAPGEIVALFGRLGCGAVELAEAVFGLRPMTSGTVEIDAVEGKPHTPSQAIQRGVGFVPIDRKAQGILQGLNLSENISVASWSQRPLFSVLRPSVVAQAFDRWQERLNIAAKEGASQAIETLSGGNQQKVVLGRWLEHRSKILVLAEPTRGVDVGARAEIYQVLRGLAGDGVGILVISSDMDEVLRIADRVVVLSRGKVTSVLHRRDLSRQVLAHAASMKAGAL